MEKFSKYFWLHWHACQGRRKALQKLGVNGKSLCLASSTRGELRFLSTARERTHNHAAEASSHQWI
jgi:hypothetical protein